MNGLRQALKHRPYPGRGCVAVRLPDGRLHLAYFLTGRSAASRNRALEHMPSGEIRVKDTSGGSHDSLRHYTAAVRRSGWTVVGNGDQVEPLATALSQGMDPASAWSAHTYEPDPPIHTPRIWMAVRHEYEALLLGSASRSARSDGGVDRLLLMPEALPVGQGVLLTTYTGSIDEVVTSGVPTPVRTIADSDEALVRELWEALDPTLAVGAFATPADDLTAAHLVE